MIGYARFHVSISIFNHSHNVRPRISTRSRFQCPTQVPHWVTQNIDCEVDEAIGSSASTTLQAPAFHSLEWFWIRIRLYYADIRCIPRYSKSDAGAHAEANFRPYSKSDASTDANAHAEDNSRHYSKSNAGAHAEANSRPYSESDASTDAGAHAEANSRHYSKSDASTDAGAHAEDNVRHYSKSDASTDVYGRRGSYKCRVCS